MTEATSFWGGGGAGLGVVKAGTKGLTVVATKSLTVLTTLLKKEGDSLLPLKALNGFLVGVRVAIATVDILEALRLSNIVVVGNIDSNGRS